MKILLVEDDRTIAAGLEYSLQNEGFDIAVCHDIHSGKKIISEQVFGLYLLDVSLPDGTGYELCNMIREKSNTPIIFLTALDEEVNVVMGLDMGADDYITKPFRLRELISRIKSVLRRYSKGSDNAAVFEMGALQVNMLDAKVMKNQKEINLTALEYRLLLTFINHKGQILTRNQLLESIWDVAGDFVNDNTLTVYIKRIRDKLEDDPQKPQIIQTVRGLGYKLGG
ncbi:response regulator transcription factor [Desemzia incerta]|uniref:response regulator transcription factor n=1 Tax=Desemzia incerta TaxID=82801 RepID=UPI00331498BE